MRLSFALGTCLFLMACQSLRQSAPVPLPLPATQPPPARKPFPTLLVREDTLTPSHPLRILRLKTDIQVLGNVAVTTFEFVFYNDSDRQLEGQFYFPLDAGQQVSRFAMEVNGTLREGVVVEKGQARQVFESLVRQKTDPGLLEWATGNVFRARVFPIPAKGEKRIVLACEQELKADEEGLFYQLPLRYPEILDHFEVDIRVFGGQRRALLHPEGSPGFEFSKDAEDWLVRRSFDNYLPGSDLSFHIPFASGETQTWMEESGPEETRFYTLSFPRSEVRPRKLPSYIALVWDASQSSHDRNLTQELALLDAYFQQVGNATIELIALRNESEMLGTFILRNGDWSALSARLRTIPADGATCLSCIQLGALAMVPEEVLLMSDCIGNFGEGRPDMGRAAVFVISSSPKNDPARMKALADASGGRALDLRQTAVSEALQQLTREPLRFLGVSRPGEAVTDIYPATPVAVAGGFALSGALKTDEADIGLNFGYGSTITQTLMVHLDKSEQLSGENQVSRIWAHKKLEHLYLDPEKNRREITQMALFYGIVTPFTSLLVLDRLEDYVQYQIVPPEPLKEAYYTLLSQYQARQEFELLSHIDKVAERYEVLQDWWNTEATPPAGFAPPLTTRARTQPGENATASATGNVGGLDALSDTPEEAKSIDPEPLAIDPWQPDAPYLDSLQRTGENQRYALYLRMKHRYGQMPGYYIDAAGFFAQNGDRKTGLRVLSNLAELDIAHPDLLRSLGRKLEELGQPEQAVAVFRQVLILRPDEPQSYRDLGLALARAGKQQEAIETLYEGIRRPWPGQFPDIHVLMLHEMNEIIARSPTPLTMSDIDTRLLADLPTDLRIVMDWDSHDVDIDLWVTDPRGEKCYYANRRTAIGGRMSPDFTQGYGPEEYLIRKARPGIYKVEVTYYSTRRQDVFVPVNVQLQFFTNYGRRNQTLRETGLRLGKENEVLLAGEIEIH